MNERLTIEQALLKIGNSGRYQITVVIIYIFMFFVTYFPYCGGPYLFLDPVFICQNGEECKQAQACKEIGNDYQKVIIDQEKSTYSITFEFELYCNRRTLRSTAQSFLFIGSFLGSVIFSYLMDNIGRKKTQILCIICMLIGEFILTFSQNVYMVMAGLCLTGMGIYPSNQLSNLVMSEISTGKFRELTTSMILIGSSISAITMAFLSYGFDNNWKILVGYFITLPTTLILLPNILFFETPRYYMDKNPQKVVRQLNKIAKFNKKQTRLTEDEIDFTDYYKYQGEKRPNYLSLFKIKSIRNSLLLATLQRFIMMFVIYGQVYGMTDLQLNIYQVGIYPSIAEIVSYLFSSILILKIKRRISVCILISILSCSDICFIFYQVPQSCIGQQCWQKVVSLIMFCISKACAIQYFMLIGMYFPELFPTKVRGLGLGFIRAFGECGSILSPYLVEFSEDINLNPLILVGTFGIFSLFTLIKMKETSGVKLQDVLEEDLNDDNLQSDSQFSQKLNKNDGEELKAKIDIQYSENLQRSNNETEFTSKSSLKNN